MVQQLFETYTIGYQCYNCGHKFSKQLPKGTIAEGHGGMCSVCGVKESSEKKFKVIPVDKIKEILLEGKNG